MYYKYIYMHIHIHIYVYFESFKVLIIKNVVKKVNAHISLHVLANKYEI